MKLVERTVTPYVEATGETASQKQASVPLDSIRSQFAYILLGDPGMGKSSAFEVEAASAGAGVKPISAHDFIDLTQHAAAWAGKTIFIDGLDETRAGNNAGRTPLGAIRKKLDELGRPPFRLSCRAADWLGASDQAALQGVLPAGQTLSVFTLDPITDDDVETILANNHGVAHPREFASAAGAHRLSALLKNPQTLELLAKAVEGGNKWPETRQEIYEMACTQLAAEPNKEHKAANRGHTRNIADIIAAAGYLCTLNLIADVQDFSMDAVASSQSMALDAIDNVEKLPLDAALHTRLFRIVGEDCFAPAHRSIAEYLAAKFIAEKIKGNLPAGRVLALICGADGGVVTGLRLFAAWLAVLSPAFRHRQIVDDPMGLLSYSDVKGFSTNEKKQILATIKTKRDSPLGIQWGDWYTRGFSALATPDMSDEFAGLLSVTPLTDGDQTVANCVVEALRDSEPIPNLGPALLRVVRDNRWQNYIRRTALVAYLRKYCADDAARSLLLSDVHQGVITDDEDELLGVLLMHMFPNQLAPEDVVSYLKARKNKNLLGEYWRFWSGHLLELTPQNLLIRLVGAFIRSPAVSSLLDSFEYSQIISPLVARAIVESGDEIDDGTLYDWLGLLSSARTSTYVAKNGQLSIDDWFQSRPQRYKGALAVSLARTQVGGGYSFHILDHFRRFKPPSDIGFWWLEQAEKATNADYAEIYFRESFFIDDDGEFQGGMTHDFLVDWVNARPQFCNALDQKLSCNLEDNAWRIDHAQHEAKVMEKKKKIAARFLTALMPSGLNLVAPQTLYEIALAYSGRLSDAHGESPSARLADFFNRDAELISASLNALRGALARPDLPSVEQMLASDRQGKDYHLTPALVIAMGLCYEANPSDVLALDEALTMQALVAQYVWREGGDDKRGWVEALVAHKPQLVADAYLRVTQQRLKAGVEFVDGLHELAHEPMYAEVARRVVAKLLAGFPKKSSLRQLSALASLLNAALRYVDRQELELLIKSKLKLKSLDVGQRIYWMAIGVVVDDGQYLAPLVDYVGRDEIRVEHLATFFHQGLANSGASGSTSDVATATLITLIAPSCKPDRVLGVQVGRSDGARADLVRHWIDGLAAETDAAVTATLKQLAELPSLAAWSDSIASARLAQLTAARDFSHVHPNPSQVIATLTSGAPSNAADIAAIVNETLESLANEIPTDALNVYRQFWNVDSHDRPTTPKPEAACRDAFTAMLRGKLQKYEIQCVAEASHVDQKRSDVWCTHGSHGVPIEMKRNQHRDIWRAVAEQLIPKYTIDPRAQGFGIYLVFWFGMPSKMPSPPTDRKPTNAVDLEQRLTALIPEPHRHQIKVHVIDCSSRKAPVQD